MTSNNILIVVDVQNDFVHGVLGGELQKGIVENVCNKIKEALANNQMIIFTRDSHDDDYLKTREGKHLPIEHCIYGTPGWEIISEIKKLIRDYSKIFTIDKNGFGLSDLDMKLITSRIEKFGYDDPNFEICGLVTNMCVLAVATSIQSTYTDSEITVDASCCASFDKVLHEKALDIMEGLQMNVINR